MAPCLSMGACMSSNRLGFPLLLHDIFHNKSKILRRCAHGAAAVVSQGHVAGTQNPLGPVFPGPGGCALYKPIGGYRPHGAHINAPGAHGAHPHPGVFVISSSIPRAAIRRNLRGSIPFKAGGRASRRTGTAGQAQVQIPAIGQDSARSIHKGVFFAGLDFYRLIHCCSFDRVFLRPSSYSQGARNLCGCQCRMGRYWVAGCYCEKTNFRALGSFATIRSPCACRPRQRGRLSQVKPVLMWR